MKMLNKICFTLFIVGIPAFSQSNPDLEQCSYNCYLQYTECLQTNGEYECELEYENCEEDCEQQYPYEDFDGDGIPTSNDNCPFDYNPSQDDCDGDGIGDPCDSINYRDKLIDTSYNQTFIYSYYHQERYGDPYGVRICEEYRVDVYEVTTIKTYRRTYCDGTTQLYTKTSTSDTSMTTFVGNCPF